MSGDEGSIVGGGMYFWHVLYIGVIIFLFRCEGSQNILLLFVMNLASPLPIPGINNEWSLTGGRIVCLFRKRFICAENMFFYAVGAQKRCLFYAVGKSKQPRRQREQSGFPFKIK